MKTFKQVPRYSLTAVASAAFDWLVFVSWYLLSLILFLPK